METSAKLYSLSFSNVKTYLFAFLFVAGNIALPQLCHLVPMGGPTLLPIYFFTLIAAYKFGFRVGLLTALLSPVINHLLFGMPAAAAFACVADKIRFACRSRCICCTIYKEDILSCIAWCDSCLPGDRHCF